MLSECRHNGLGVHNCFIRSEVAGVNCSGKFFSNFSKEDYYSKTSLSGHSEKRTHSLQRTM